MVRGEGGIDQFFFLFFVVVFFLFVFFFLGGGGVGPLGGKLLLYPLHGLNPAFSV